MEPDIFMNDQAHRKALRDLYFEAGAGLFDCQHFEYGIKVLIYVLSQQQFWSYDLHAAEKILEGRSKKTLGALIQILRDQGFLDEDIEKLLTDALAARNNLIHNYLSDNAERMILEMERKQMVREIRAFRRVIQQADRAIGKVIEGMTLYLTLMSIDVDQLMKQASAQINNMPSDD